MRKGLVATVTVLIALVVAGCGGGGTGKTKGITGGGTGPFDMQAVGPAGGIAGLNTPFSVTVNFFEPGTTNPRAVTGSVSAAVFSGTGTLSGTTTVNVGGATSANFNNLMLNATGAHVIRFSSAGATAPADTATFNVVNMYGQAGAWSMLKTGRVGIYYSDTLTAVGPTGATVFSLISGSLPNGLTLNTSTGEVSGTPSAAGNTEFNVLVASSTVGMSLRCLITIFTANETEITSGQNFKTAGPYTVAAPIVETFTFTSSFDNITWPQGGTPACHVQIYYPNFAGSPAPPSPAPLLIHHRGRGFHYLDYDLLGAHVASYGFIFVSVEDYQSFLQAGGPTSYAAYDNNDIARCHTSASAFQEGAMRHILTKNATSGDPLHQRVDPDNIFFSGHSRGGGATHYSHRRAAEIGIKGVIYFMAYDLRNFTQFVNGTTTPPPYYAIPTPQPRLPSLIIAAENDGDLTYPICDQFIDRATGPATFLTVYGGNHNFLGDTNAAEIWSTPYITRQEEQERIFNFVIAFLKRWGQMDLSLEGFLYCNQHAGSNEVGVTAWRGMAGQKLLDNHQNGVAGTNTLGGTNSIAGGTFSIASSIYPNTGNMASLQLRHNIVTVASGATVTYTSTLPAGQQNVSTNRRFIFRCGSVDASSTLKGFDWTTVRVRLTDAQNDQATVTLFDRTAPSTTYLPDYPGSGSNVYDRFVEASIMLSAFTTATPALNLDQITQVQIILESATGTTRQFYFDDTRFE